MIKQDMVSIGIVLDGTLSFTTVYPQIFYMLEQMLGAIRKRREDMEHVDFRYSLTVLHDHAESVHFDEGCLYTSDERELLHRLSEIDFYGGTEAGPENLTEAINLELKVLHTTSGGAGAKGLIVLSDALPKGGNNYPDFTSCEPGTYGNYKNGGLNFARVFTGCDDYMPQFRMVDRRGHVCEDAASACAFGSLSELLDRDEAQMITCALALADDLLGLL